MRKDVKLGLAVGGILFGAVMVYVLFFAGGKAKQDQARLNSQVPTDSRTAETSPLGSGSDTAVSSGHPLSSLLPTQEATATTRPVESTLPYAGSSAVGSSATISIGGPTTDPATPVAPVSSPDVATVVPSSSFNWRDVLEHGANNGAVSRSVTPVSESDNAAVGRAPTFGSAVADATAADATATSRSSTGTRTYVVKMGDTFWSIAKAEYGSPSYYPHLVRANAKVGNRLRAGMKIILPAKEEVVPESAKPLLTTPRVVDGSKQYRVQSGDNLYTICKKLYGKTDRVAKLYELNKDLIGPNPSALKPNMVLQLPEPPASSTTANGSSSAADGGSDALAGTLQ